MVFCSWNWMWEVFWYCELQLVYSLVLDNVVYESESFKWASYVLALPFWPSLEKIPGRARSASFGAFFARLSWLYFFSTFLSTTSWLYFLAWCSQLTHCSVCQFLVAQWAWRWCAKYARRWRLVGPGRNLRSCGWFHVPGIKNRTVWRGIRPSCRRIITR